MSRHMQRRSFSIWDRVHPSFWHPLATLEQSLSELDRATNHVLSAPFQLTRRLLPQIHHGEKDDFFHDLMPKERPPTPPSKAPTQSKAPAQAVADDGPDAHSFSSYSYSASTVVDNNGHEVSSVRRRYEDSTGRLKAVHLREIDGERLKTMWRRDSAEDPGKHETVCSAGSPEEFEKRWRETPFGHAETHHHGRIEEKRAALIHEVAKLSDNHEPGPDYDAASRAPGKRRKAPAGTMISEAETRSREEAIAEGSKNQEEETTPPHYG